MYIHLNIYVLASAVHVQQEKESTHEGVCSDVKHRSEGDMKGLYSNETSGSTDFETHLISSADDAKAGIVLDPSSVKSRNLT